ncbi:serine O-acetyltransferase [Methanospirillum lacunae]|uniref:Serine acetyltransferase n=1 Tax=Methanospirillum lacunae TaxID=668570 RepID=A0A2V2N5W7_9EURY|nr:serine O-acetyltransferase [Methanospirillum lacunae]PWR70911.1 serine O-acetyltransferase [Methanospirillum lacunae]
MIGAQIREDISSILQKDPAARSRIEILFCYPGLHALTIHRVAHRLWLREHRLAARFLSHISRFFTGIEIHPGATIGRRVVIDHGMGVVIGETAEVGDEVLLYMGVVLGGTTLTKVKRHPTLGKGVVIGSGAAVLGPVTLGDYAKVGAGAVVVRDVPPGATVVGVPGRIAGLKRHPTQDDIRDNEMPDPTLRVISRMLERQSSLEEKIQKLEKDLVCIRQQAPVTPISDREAEIWAALRQIIDPEIGHNIVDVGLIKLVEITEEDVNVEMSLNTESCPLLEYLVNQVENRLKLIEWVRIVKVEVIHDPWESETCQNTLIHYNEKSEGEKQPEDFEMLNQNHPPSVG